MSPKLVLVLLCMVAAGSVNADQQKWTNLKVHFSTNPLSKYYYQTQPRTVSSLKASDWTNISGNDCTNGGKYNGFRYVENSESGMALLFDSQGTIAGIQQILNKQEVQTNSAFHYDKVPQYNPDTFNGQDVYVLTAYFVDPETICTSGRDASQLTSDGTGNLLQLQAGPTPVDLLEMPRARSEAIAQGWSKNKCFVGMGYHNFYKVEDMASTNCLEIVPYFGLYDNNGDQIGFGFASYGTAQSNHFEHPPSLAVKAIVGADQVPQCLLDGADKPGLSTMHVFFTDRPYLYACIL